MKYFVKGFENYANFSGRATRTEYWMFYLFYTIFYFLIYGIIFVGASMENDTVVMAGSALVVLYVLGTLLPMWTVSVRRLHDIGKSGWFILINMIPIAGAIWFLVLMCTDSQPGSNSYGANPKGL